nr:12531_t:CDS:2 [Entrophospora candida]
MKSCFLITEHISNANNNSRNNNQYPISHYVYFYNLFTTNSNNSNTNDQNNIDEYNNYLNLPSISDNIKVDTLTWWKAHQEEFPTLAKIANDYLSIQATSVPNVGEINIDNDLVVEKDDIDCLIYLDE